MISVVIPVKNGGEDLRRCLDGIARQSIDEEVEVVVIDSGSTDGSLELARSRGARIAEIPPEQFNHGAVRNQGAALARGDLLVFTSQDAYAVDERWLATLRGALGADPELAGAYGRQLPHDSASPPEEYFLTFLYGPEPRTQRSSADNDLSLHTTLFSNVNSAVPRVVWEQFPFAEDIIMSEDQEWSVRVLRAGYAVRYEPAAAVRHSHAYTIASALHRFFDSGVSAERAYLAGARRRSRALRRAALAYARGEVAWLWHTGRRSSIPHAAVYETAKLVGLQLGAHHRLLPRWAKTRLSAHPRYWTER